MNRAGRFGVFCLPPATVVAGAGLTAPAVIAEAGEKAAWLLSSCIQPVRQLIVCTKGTEQTQSFGVNFAPTSCVNSYKGTGTCNANATGNVEIAVGGVTCSFSSLVPPSAKVQYFSGPEQPNGTAGTVNMSFTVNFSAGSQSHTDAAAVACPQ